MAEAPALSVNATWAPESLIIAVSSVADSRQFSGTGTAPARAQPNRYPK